MKLWMGVVTTLWIGCGGGGSAKPDAAHDAGPDAVLHCGSGGSGPAMYTVFINTEGATLTYGTNDDARTNTSTLIPSGSGGTVVFPPFNQNDTGRAAFIMQMVNMAKAALAPYSIDLVTTRPASGEYAMIVFGGSPSLVGAPNGTGGIAPQACNFANHNKISLNFDGNQTTMQFADAILSDIGVFGGLGGVTSANDCMNRAMYPTNGALCAFGSASTSDPQTGCGRGVVDEPAEMAAAYGCR